MPRAELDIAPTELSTQRLPIYYKDFAPTTEQSFSTPGKDRLAIRFQAFVAARAKLWLQLAG
jgi:hypothetical protein